MTLLSWNVAGRVRASQERQLEALFASSKASPYQELDVPYKDLDVLCLQEVTPTTRARWEEALAERGFEVAVSEWGVPPKGSRRLAVLTAARTGPVRPIRVPGLPWPERHLGALVSLGGGAEVELHNLHSPLSSKEGKVKVRTLEAVFEAVTRPSEGRPRIVTGDINTPRYESREGEIASFARTRSGRLRPERGERHDRAELGLIAELPRRGWRDAFRALHGYERRDRSWVSSWGEAYRLDHVLLSPGLRPVACDYEHEWRERGLSDHSAIWARIELELASLA